MKTRLQKVVAVVFFVLLLGSVGIVGAYFGTKWLHLSKFKGSLPEYVSYARPNQGPEDRKPGGPPEPVESWGEPGSAKPRMITVNLGENPSIDWTYFSLPRSMQAQTPEEVETVVWLEWWEAHEGDYDNGAEALVHLCEVTVFDRASKQAVGQSHFRGGPPPETTESKGKVYGSKPTKEIVDFLKRMAGQ
jgi:hypothetical protein